MRRATCETVLVGDGASVVLGASALGRLKSTLRIRTAEKARPAACRTGGVSTMVVVLRADSAFGFGFGSRTREMALGSAVEKRREAVARSALVLSEDKRTLATGKGLVDQVLSAAV